MILHAYTLNWFFPKLLKEIQGNVPSTYSILNSCLIFHLKSFFSQRQVIYTANTGYVMTQGGPVAIPMQAGAGMVAVQTVTPGAQGGQPQMVMVPVSGAEGYPPHLVQSAPAGAMATGYQPQQVQSPPPYAQGQYMTKQNEQVWLVDLVSPVLK